MKNKIGFRNGLAACALLTALGGQAWAGDDTGPGERSREETLGMAGGAVLGAAVGGPPGFIVGLIGGHFVGRTEGQARELTELRQALARAEQSVAETQRQAEAERRAYESRAVLVASTEPVALGTGEDPFALIRHGFGFTVQFRTDRHEVEPHFATQLRALGASLRELPGLNVRLEGFADGRGQEAHNLELSQRRAAAVREVLLQAGLDAERVRLAAHGDSRPLYSGDERETLPFERRVLIGFEQE